MAAILFIIFIAFIANYIIRRRMTVLGAKSREASEQQLMDYLNALRETRIIDDFVLTCAAVPALEAKVKPTEGYRLFPHEGYFKLFGGSVIVASVSAEKLRGLMLSFVDTIGEAASISFSDYHSDVRHVVDYIAYNRDAYMVAHMLDRNWLMIVNNADIVPTLFSTEIKVEIILSQARTIHIHAVEPAPYIGCLHEYGVTEKPDMHFIYEDAYFLHSDDAVSKEFFNMVHSFGYDEKRFYEKEEH